MFDETGDDLFTDADVGEPAPDPYTPPEDEGGEDEEVTSFDDLSDEAITKLAQDAKEGIDTGPLVAYGIELHDFRAQADPPPPATGPEQEPFDFNLMPERDFERLLQAIRENDSHAARRLGRRFPGLAPHLMGSTR